MMVASVVAMLWVTNCPEMFRAVRSLRHCRKLAIKSCTEKAATSARGTTPIPITFPITVPDHKSIKPGLLRQILRNANLTVDEFLTLIGRRR